MAVTCYVTVLLSLAFLQASTPAAAARLSHTRLYKAESKPPLLGDLLDSTKPLEDTGAGFDQLFNILESLGPKLQTDPSTFFIPTNAAWEEFEKHGGLNPRAKLSYKELGLLGGLGYYTYISTGTYTPAQLVAKRNINSALGTLTKKSYDLHFSKSDHAKVYVSDSFGHAALLGKPIKVSNGVVYPIDKILQPSKHFRSGPLFYGNLPKKSG